MNFSSAILYLVAALQEPNLKSGIDTSISACENWLLNPAIWVDNIDKFPEISGLDKNGLVKVRTIPDVALPPPTARKSLHFWHVNIGENGLYVSSSDRIPLCHIAGGGPSNFVQSSQALIEQPNFRDKWELLDKNISSDIQTLQYNYISDPKLSLTLSFASNDNLRTDRMQFLATLQYSTGN